MYSATSGLLVVEIVPSLIEVSQVGPATPPPGAGVLTPIFSRPEVAIIAAGTAAVMSLALTKVVASGALLAVTTVAGLNPEPVTVIIVSPLPAVTAAGEMEVNWGEGDKTVTVAELEVWLPALADTVTLFGEGGIAGAV